MLRLFLPGSLRYIDQGKDPPSHLLTLFKAIYRGHIITKIMASQYIIHNILDLLCISAIRVDAFGDLVTPARFRQIPTAIGAF